MSTDTSPISAVDAAAVLGRIGAAASALEIEAAPLIASLSRLSGSIDSRVRVTMPADARRLGVRLRWPDDPAGQTALDGWLAERDATELARSIHARGHASIELGTDGTLWLHADGDPERGGGDLALAAAPSLRRGLAALGGASHGVSRLAGAADARILVRLDATNAPPAIDAAAVVLGIAPRQRALIGDIHRLLVRRPQVLVNLSSGASGDELWIGYPDVSWETAVRVTVPVLPGREPGRSLGHLAGAIGARDVASLVLVLRRQDPLRVLVSVDLRAGADR